MSRLNQTNPSSRRTRRSRAGALALLGALVLSATGAREARAGAASACIQTQYGGSLGCTSQDVKIASFDLLAVVDGCTGPSDVAQVNLRANLLVGANQRYDIGFFLALDGGNALTGSCYKDWLNPVKAPQGTDPTSTEITSGFGPFLNSDGDTCGDAKAVYGQFDKLVGSGSPDTLTLPCTDTDSDGFLDVGNCAGWKNQANNDCGSLAQAGIPDVASKCYCGRTNINVAVPANDPTDWGDAPNTYGTQSASNGARHTVVGTGPRLGACVDTETNGQPNVAASGDDAGVGTTTVGTCAAANDDEDGVTFGTIVPGQSATFTVVATAACTLSAFVDWAGDGSFATAGDDILPSGQLLSAGSNTVTITVPAGAKVGDTYARFRCATSGKLSYNGLAANGEVEDYKIAVTLLPPSLTVAKKAMLAGGTCGVNDTDPPLTIFTGQQVEYCYYVTAGGTAGTTQPVCDVTLVDDMTTPSDTADDQTITLSGLTNLCGSAGIGDLAAGSTATGKSAPVQF